MGHGRCGHVKFQWTFPNCCFLSISVPSSLRAGNGVQTGTGPRTARWVCGTRQLLWCPFHFAWKDGIQSCPSFPHLPLCSSWALPPPISLSALVTLHPGPRTPLSMIPPPLPCAVRGLSSEVTPLFRWGYFSCHPPPPTDVKRGCWLLTCPLGDHPSSPSCKNSWVSEAQLCSSLSLFLF